MNKITISGQSDDLIQIDGDIKEEFGCYDEENIKLAFSDGTVLSVNYDKDGIWRINAIVYGKSNYSKQEGYGDEHYSDIVTLEGDNLEWVLMGIDFAKAKK